MEIYTELSKKIYMESEYEKGFVVPECLSYHQYENAYILPINGMNGGVMTDEKTFVQESRIEWIGGCYECSEYSLHSGNAVYLGSDKSSWGNFLVHVVPRLWIHLFKSNVADEYVIIRKNGDTIDLFDNEKEFFELLGIEGSRVRVINSPVKYRRVIIPELSFDLGRVSRHKAEFYLCTGHYLATFDYVVREAMKKDASINVCRRIFMARQKEGDIIKQFFVDNGYEVIYPEKLSLSQLILLLHHCEDIAYLSGTLQHNMLFAENSRNTIAVERRITLSPFQIGIDKMKGLSPVYVNAQYTILPDKPVNSSIYAYTDNFVEFANNREMKLPDKKYMSKEMIVSSIVEYLNDKEWDDNWMKIAPEYYLDLIP